MSLTQITVQTASGPVEVTGDQVTEHFAITPALTGDDDDPMFTGGACLTHIPTGRAITYSYSGLRGKAERLESLSIDWSAISAENRISKEDAPKVLAALNGPDDGEGWPWPEWAGDESTPALTALAQSLDRALERDYWDRANALAKEAAPHLDEELAKKLDAYVTSAASVVAVSEYGLTYLLAVLHRVDPDAADRAARDLVGAWDAGDTMGEWQWQWRDELGKGQPLTLHGFPSLGDLPTEGGEGK